ncbi:MAG: YraN family protein [bacterium]|nr:YraN family protein [bacterium]
MLWGRRYARLSKDQLGRLGEKLGARFLRRRGHRVLARNYTCTAGEIDLIMLDAPTVVFVEVKTRRADGASWPEDAVHTRKRRRITAAAKCYLKQTGAEARPCRFDVVAVVLGEGRKPEIEHFVDAFGPTPR